MSHREVIDKIVEGGCTQAELYKFIEFEKHPNKKLRGRVGQIRGFARKALEQGNYKEAKEQNNE